MKVFQFLPRSFMDPRSGPVGIVEGPVIISSSISRKEPIYNVGPKGHIIRATFEDLLQNRLVIKVLGRTDVRS